MNKFLRYLFPLQPDSKNISLLLLAARIIFGIAFMTHGYQKIAHFAELSSTFPDPLGVGRKVSLSLIIFGEFIAPLGFITGILYRAALIPMMFGMMVAFMMVGAGQPFSERELPFMYLTIFILLFIAGPGKYSLDYWIGTKLHDDKISRY